MKERSDQNVVAYISMMRDKLDEIATVVHSNLTAAHQQQKVWYDRQSRERSFEPPDSTAVEQHKADNPVARTLQGNQTRRKSERPNVVT